MEALFLGRSLRENADYYGDFSKDGAKELSILAKRFFREAKTILNDAH